MKKKLYIIFVLILFSFTFDVLAFTGDYNYEVKNLSRNGNIININGWAIPNAGITESRQRSPRLNKNKGSGSSRSCITNNKNNYYQYTLYAVPVDANNNFKTDLSDAVKLGTVKGSDTSLTTVMCYTANGGCVRYRSPCYENVGWSFSFDETKVIGDKFKYGYVLFLSLYASGDSSTVSFPLVAYKDRISGFGSTYKYTSLAMNVQVIAYDGYYQRCSNGSCSRKSQTKFRHDKIYQVLGLATNRKGLTYYKVGKDLFIPSPWVAPPKTDAVILPPTDTNKDVDSCNDTTTSQAPITKEILACSGTQTFNGSNFSGCYVNEYTYYTEKCNEDNYKISANIGNIQKTKFDLIPGGGFTANASITTSLKCLYTFDTKKFVEDYQNILNNLDYYKQESSDWYYNYNLKTKLDGILTSYQEKTKYISNWNSNYDFTKITAVLKVDDDEENLITSGVLKSNNSCQIKENQKIILNNKAYSINTNYECKEDYKIEYELPEVCLNLTTGKPEKCGDSSNQIAGGKKYYIDLNKTSGNIELNLKNLGYDAKWNLVLKNCSYKSGLIKDKILYRQIDVSDPFISSNKDRTIGKNYKNDKYNFVSIIKANIWSIEEFDYRFSLSKVNVNNIIKDTSLNGNTSYLGTNCYLTNNKYICDFIRNKDNVGQYFTKIELSDDKIS